MLDEILIVASGTEISATTGDLSKIGHLVYKCPECNGDYHPHADPDTPEERQTMAEILALIKG